MAYNSSNCKLKFLPFSSVVSTAFWESLSNLKLNELCLKTEPLKVMGVYSRRIVEGIPSLLQLDHDSLQEVQRHEGEVICPGTLINTNTIQEFKNSDKYKILKDVSAEIWTAISSGEAENNPIILSSFLLYTYADLKKYHFYYWFAFPAFMYPQSLNLVSKPQTLEGKLEDHLLETIHSLLRSESDLAYFTLLIKDGKASLLPLSSYYKCCMEKLEEKENRDVYLGFSDSSNLPDHPSWNLRNLLTLAVVRWTAIKTHVVLALRERVSSESCSIGDSLVFEVTIKDEEEPPLQMPSPLGWEKNERGKMGPRLTNLIKTMNPSRVAESAVELNLKLMKWRLDPVLDLDVIKNCSCLLIGAGTLGCNVARCLLGWGVQKLTFVDNGRVSHSNPVRQSLYVFEDCLKEGKMKCEAAAEALRRIFPLVNTKGVSLSVPMPGHAVSESQSQQVASDVAMLEQLFDDHQAVFLLTDSRESRWLPSLLGAAKKKIVLTAALGFDSYLVMRHGIRTGNESDSNSVFNVGCYFCNDVVAPGDSLSDRTLDQQCTVTRPGVSYMAAGHAVEMLIDILQYPVRLKACEVVALRHSIRYYLGRMDQLVTASPAFKNCSACSESVVSAFRDEGIQFLMKVFNSPSHLENVSGLTKLHQESERVELLEVSTSEDDEE